jgi:hypothetical protein
MYLPSSIPVHGESDVFCIEIGQELLGDGLTCALDGHNCLDVTCHIATLHWFSQSLHTLPQCNKQHQLRLEWPHRSLLILPSYILLTS